MSFDPRDQLCLRAGFIVSIFPMVLAVAIRAATVDTLITADGTPGPYSLGSRFIRPSSLVVTYQDTLAGPVPPYTFEEEANRLMFSEPIDSGRTLSIRYSTAFYGLQKKYSLFQKITIDTADSQTRQSVLPPMPSPFFPQQNLSVSGYKSIGASLGNLGHMNLEQALDVSIEGTIAPQTTLSANLSDQGTSLEGATREIGELDMVYIALTNPRYRAVAGDQYRYMPPGGLLYGQKKIKGISAGYTGRRISSEGFGAISGGRYAVQTQRGVMGFQGPYVLRGNGEADIINPIAGTITVLVDGTRLTEGTEGDYVVDYEMGTLTFTPAFPIDDDQVIRIEYEYKSFDYQRMSFGADAGFAAPDSTVWMGGLLWCDMDNKHHPIESEPDAVILDSLHHAGDRIPSISHGRRVHPNDVAKRDALYSLYRIDTSATGEKIYVYEPAPSDTQELYLVWFREVGSGQGEYVKDSTQKQGRTVYYYRHDTSGGGEYTSSSPFPAPARTSLGQLSLGLKPREWLSFKSDIAGEEIDKNLFSPTDDRDNYGSAVRSSLHIGRERIDERTLWFTAAHTYISRRFSQEIVPFFDLKQRWDRPFDMHTSGERHLWESSAGITPLPGLSTQFSYGQHIRRDSLLTQRLANATRIQGGDHFSLEYSGDLFRHADMPGLEYKHSDHCALLFDFPRTSYGVRLDGEWRFGSADTGAGMVGGGAEFRLKPADLRESVYYTRRIKGDRFLLSPDTTAILTWRQSVNHSPIRGWRYGGTSTLQRRTRPGDTLTTLLISALNDIVSPRTGLTSRQTYTVTSEKASAYIQVPVYAGEGLGYYSFDTTKNEYAPDPIGGSYYLDEREVYDTTTAARTRKTSLRGTWSLKPPVKKGFLADISLNGMFTIDEHLGGEFLPLTSWLPGYLFLSQRNDADVSYGYVLYRQDLKWRPQKPAGLHAGLFIKPAKRKVRSHIENGLEWGGDIGRSGERLTLKAEGCILTIRRDNLWNPPNAPQDTIRDRHIDLTETLLIRSPWSLFVEETVGWADRSAVAAQEQDGTAASNRYYKVRPGISFQPKGKGFAEASYAFTFVDIPGTLDYRMAQGYNGGFSHTIEAMADLKVGKHFAVSGNYRGEIVKPLGANAKYGKGLHVVSMEVKAYL